MTKPLVVILGAGWYGCAIAEHLVGKGFPVEVWEQEYRPFMGASGSNPARLHLGWHYPRSRVTRAACQEHQEAFMKRYGFLTAHVPTNVYAVAEQDSYLDFGTYRQVVGAELEHVVLYDPKEYGFTKLEGAMLTGERRIMTQRARSYFTQALGAQFRYGVNVHVGYPSGARIIDCTFCALGHGDVERYEPCRVVILRRSSGRPAMMALTVMDGPFPSFYPWGVDPTLVSLSSALYTPLSKSCRTYWEAKSVLYGQIGTDQHHAEPLIDQMAEYYPPFPNEYELVEVLWSIRAMPRSGADTRLVDIALVDTHHWPVRAGKIDAVIATAHEMERLLNES